MNALQIQTGVYTPITVDLSEFDFNGIASVLLTLKNGVNSADPAVVQRSFTEKKTYYEVITPAESLRLKNGAVYDAAVIRADGKMYKLCENRAVELERGVSQQWQTS